MRIGIEGQRLFRLRKHGMDMVALELIRNLQIIDKKNEYVIFIKPDEDETCLKETENFKIVKLDGGFTPCGSKFHFQGLQKKMAVNCCIVLAILPLSVVLFP